MVSIDICSQTMPKSTGQPEIEFHQALEKRVGAHFEGRARKGGRQLHRKAVVIGLWFAASWAGLLVAPDLPGRLCASISLALASVAIGFNIFHDANHGAFARRRWANLWAARIASLLLGVSRHLWHVKHNVLHHGFPNVYQLDYDIESRGTLRMSRFQPWKAHHRFQHFFLPLAYAAQNFEWVFIKDFVEYARGAVNFQPVPPLTLKRHVEFWLTKLVYISIIVTPPFLVMPFSQALFTFAVFHVTLGLVVAFVTQLAHLNGDVAFEAAPGKDDRTAHRLRTTANFATENRLLTWYCGGLNYQIEHHLFPGIAHSHYPAIAPIVRETVAAFGLPYHYLGNFRQAIAKHFAHLRAHSIERSSAVASMGNAHVGAVE